MTPTPQEPRLDVLPLPREFTRLSGECDIRAGLRIQGNTEDDRLDRALDRLSAELRQEHTPAIPADTVNPCPIRMECLPGAFPHRDAYRLSIRHGAITISGGSPSGCFYAIQTLRQLAARSDGSGVIPACDISDSPDFDTRGVLHDVTRGKVPTLDTLKLLVDRLATLKGNQLQLNIEHAFVFAFDPDICGPDEGLTADEIRELDAYAQDRFIDLVPAVATLGHMGRILSMPKYRHLAERETTTPWAEMDWPQRARGLTLDCVNPEAITLVERIWSDILDAFSSPTVNICGDEPYGLGQGKNLERFRGRVGEKYLEHIRRVHDLCASRGRRVQFWSDVVINHRALYHMVPTDATVLHWGYDDRMDYASTASFTDAGLRTIVCPGTSGWKRVVNAMNSAERNIAAFSESGKAYGAAGLLNTDWGDHGHFNLLAGSWHAIALGAAKAWREDHVTGAAFDSLFAKQFFGLRDPALVSALREASTSAENCMTWKQLWMPIEDVAKDASLPSIETTEIAQASARDAIGLIRAIQPRDSVARQDLAELCTACEFVSLWAEKIRMVHASAKSMPARCLPPLFPPLARGDETGGGSGLEKLWRADIRNAWKDYRACWLARNKTGGLADIERAISRVAETFADIPGRDASS